MIKRKAIGLLLAAFVVCCMMPGVAQAMQVFVSLNVSEANRTITLEVEPSDTTEAIKAKVHEKAGILPERQTLTFDGTVLQDGRTLSDYGIPRESTIKLDHYWKVIYYSNDDSGQSAEQHVIAGTQDSLLTNSFNRPGFRFAGWNTSHDGSGENLDDGQPIAPAHDLVLFAQWEKAEGELGGAEAPGTSADGAGDTGGSSASTDEIAGTGTSNDGAVAEGGAIAYERETETVSVESSADESDSGASTTTSTTTSTKAVSTSARGGTLANTGDASIAETVMGVVGASAVCATVAYRLHCRTRTDSEQ